MENDERRIASALQGKAAKDAGKRYEDLLEDRLDALEHAGIVRSWTHNEPAYRCIWRRAAPGRPPAKSFLPVAPGQADYTGMLAGGRYFAIEAKTCKDDRFPLGKISVPQQIHLDDIARGGGLAFLALEFRGGAKPVDFLIPWLAVPWAVVRTAKAVHPEALAAWEAPRCTLVRYFDPFIWRCTGCKTVYDARPANGCCALH